MKRRILIFALICVAMLCVGCKDPYEQYDYKEPTAPTSERGKEKEDVRQNPVMIEPEDRPGENDTENPTITVSEVNGMLYPDDETRVSDNVGSQRHPDEPHTIEEETGRNLYNPGIYECSSDIKPGTYVFYADNPELVASYEITDAGSQERIQLNEFTSQSIAELRDGERLDAQSCYFEPIENAGNTVEDAPDVIKDGVWLVGYQIPEGIYNVTLQELNEFQSTNQLRIFEDPAREQAKNIILCTSDMTVYLETGDYVELAGVSISPADANAGANNTEGN